MRYKEIAITPDIDALIAAHAPIAVGVSGGKDSQASALATFDYLNAVGHRGPRVLIHSDLGVVEWKDSLPVCERLAAHLGVELIVVRRKAGDMMDRWESRWESSVRRYINLETVTLVLPWSTPSMRFCTSELKTQIIEAELRRRFPGQKVVNVTGIRRDESKARSKGTIASLNKRGDIWSWRPISDWNIDDVFGRIALSGMIAHEAYAVFGMSRVSCRFCIMSSWDDMVAASSQEESHELYRRMVSLEALSTFAFQGARWLADVAPHLLSEQMIMKVRDAKRKAAARVAVEKRITKEMLYVKGWPTRMLTDHEAAILADVRIEVSKLIGLDSNYLDVPSIHGRYAELMALNAARKTA
jgi:3'-phosphoadenosine 5'-phosphosulfate sulfotransferase (PAPS reductase)/FAD synthetase